jgi:hypothetical protein
MLAHLGRVDVIKAENGEPAFNEASVPGQGLAKVPGSDDGNPNSAHQAKFAHDGTAQVFGVVANPSHTLVAEVGKVPTHLSGSHPHYCRNGVGGNGAIV